MRGMRLVAVTCAKKLCTNYPYALTYIYTHPLNDLERSLLRNRVYCLYGIFTITSLTTQCNKLDAIPGFVRPLIAALPSRLSSFLMRNAIIETGFNKLLGKIYLFTQTYELDDNIPIIVLVHRMKI